METDIEVIFLLIQRPTFKKLEQKTKKKTKMGESFDAVGIGIYFGSYKDMLL